MPRKKKNGHSPARVPGLSNESSCYTGYRTQGTTDGVTARSDFNNANNFLTGTTLQPNSGNSSYHDNKDEIVKNMQEMFSHLDPEVIYIVLSECDFKVENAMDSLLELSVAAEGVAPLPPYISGFELTAALLSPHPPEPDPDPDPPTSTGAPPSPPQASLRRRSDDDPDLTEELDILIDRELENLTTPRHEDQEVPSGLCASANPLSSLPPPPQQALPELLQSSVETNPRRWADEELPSSDRGASVGQTSGAHSPVTELSFLGGVLNHDQRPPLEFSHLSSETARSKSNGPLDLGASGRPSAFQAYRKQNHSIPSSERSRGIPPGGIIGGARPKVNAHQEKEVLSTPGMFWNIQATEFRSRIQGNQEPSFITPVVQNPSVWNSQATHLFSQGPVSQAPLKPAATIPKSWALPTAPLPPLPLGRLRLEGQVLVLLRGAPGSGKSTVARAMLEQNPGGVVLSTDDYFSRHGDYHFDPSDLGQAHEWNHRRAKEAFEGGMSPIIIDNTNMQGWEMRPYVAQAVKHKYKVLFREPDTRWKNKPKELERRTKHGVPVERIRRMLDSYERYVSVQSIMGSRAPPRPTKCPPQPPQQENTPPKARPDLVEESPLTPGSESSRRQLFSSLPDVSSVGHSGREGTPGQSPMESLLSTEAALYKTEIPKHLEIPDEDDLTDFRELDSEMDARLGLDDPDCIVETVLDVDHRGEERPVAFSESIGQRVRRGRRVQTEKTDTDRLEPVDLVKDTSQSERGVVGKEGEVEEGGMGAEGAAVGERVRDGGERVRPELLDFVWDWPSEGGLGKRERGRRRKCGEREEEGGGGAGQEAGHRGSKIEGRVGPDVTEFQKLLDLLQTGVGSSPMPASPSPDSPLGNALSFSSDQLPGEGGESLGEGEAGGRRGETHSPGEGRDQVSDRGGNNRAELPDCVIDWRAVGQPQHSVVVESETGEQREREGIQAVGEGDIHTPGVSRQTGCFNLLEDIKLRDFLSCVSADTSATPGRLEVEGGHHGEGSQKAADGSHVGEVSADAGPDSDASQSNIGGGHVGEVSLSANSGHVSEVSVEADGGHVGGGSQERRQRQSRRSGKQCKLALTFTHNSPSSPKSQVEGRHATALTLYPTSNLDPDPNPDPKPNLDPDPNPDPKPNLDPKLNPNPDPNPEPKPNLDPKLNPNLDADPKPNPSLDPKPKPNPDYKLNTNTNPGLDLDHNPNPLSDHELRPRPPTPSSAVDSGRPTQTDPQDFALLWRLDRHDNPDDLLVSAGHHPSDVNVVRGESSRFVPEVSSVVSAAVAVHPSGQRVVPYRVVHEKGTQVEERELGSSRTRLQSLRILSGHFKLVSFDMLEDLYDKCQQDLEWTTNLLLDSGERLFRDEYDASEGGSDEDLNTFALLGMAEGAGLVCSSVLEERTRTHFYTEVEPSGGLDVEAQALATGCSSTSGGVIGLDGGGSTSDSEPSSALVGGEEGISVKGISGEAGGLSEAVSVTDRDHGESPPSGEPLHPPPSLAPRPEQPQGGSEVTKQEVTSEIPCCEPGWEGGAGVGRWEEGGDELSCVDEVTQHLLAQLEAMERRGEDEKREEQREQREREEKRNKHMDIRSVELKLPTELALQLTELFGPVGIDAGACDTDDYAVQMDLNMARLLHQKWKDTIQERQRQAALSYHLLQESSVHWGESQTAKTGLKEGTRPAHFLIGADGFASLGNQPEAQDEAPFMDHWSVSRPHVSLRDIMTEEQVLQNMERSRLGRADPDRRDGAALLKEGQLYALFPTIDRHFLRDIFRDHNYCLVQTEQFLRSLLDEGPVKTVVAPEPTPQRPDTQRTHSKDRDKRCKAAPEPDLSGYQDVEDPEYQDFRAEAGLQRGKQQESFSKAAEAYRQGRKDVASFYAQQGHLHGSRMREANDRAAGQIFERVNASLLPQNILDLHGLHVDEALQHLGQVLLDKTTEWKQGLCRPQLSVITGRGNHSQGGVARIRPAVLDYLNSQRYRFTEPKPGLVLVSLN